MDDVSDVGEAHKGGSHLVTRLVSQESNRASSRTVRPLWVGSELERRPGWAQERWWREKLPMSHSVEI